MLELGLGIVICIYAVLGKLTWGLCSASLKSTIRSRFSSTKFMKYVLNISQKFVQSACNPQFDPIRSSTSFVALGCEVMSTSKNVKWNYCKIINKLLSSKIVSGQPGKIGVRVWFFTKSHQNSQPIECFCKKRHNNPST